jgi:MFS family permease
MNAPISHRWWVLAVVIGGQFMFVVDAFIVNVAVPSIRADLQASGGAMEAVIAIYQLAYATLVITGGRLGDMHGRRRLFLIGLLGFTAASILCGLASTSAMLIAARLAQGAAAALMSPQVLATIHTLFPDAARTRAFAVFGIALGLGGATGFLLGGWALAFVVASRHGARRFASRGLRSLIEGCLLEAAGLLAVVLVVAGGTSQVPLILALGVFGYGQGLVMAPLFSAILAAVRHAHAGSGAGLLTTVQQVANGIGVALIGGLYFAVQPTVGDTGALLVSLLDAVIALLATAVLLARMDRLARHMAVAGGPAAYHPGGGLNPAQACSSRAAAAMVERSP